MFNQVERVSFKLLYEKFEEECKRVVSILSTSQEIQNFKKLKDCIIFTLGTSENNINDTVYGYNFYVDMENGQDGYSVSYFPYRYLMLSDEELKELVKKADQDARNGTYVGE